MADGPTLRCRWPPTQRMADAPNSTQGRRRFLRFSEPNGKRLMIHSSAKIVSLVLRCWIYFLYTISEKQLSNC